MERKAQVTIPDPDQIFDGDFHWSQKLQESHAHYESTVVKKLLSYHKLPPIPKELAVCFASFYEEYPEFPVTICVGNLWGISDIDLSELFKHFTKTKIFKSYQGCVDRFYEDKPLAMVFKWPRLSNFTVLHDAIHDFSIKAPVFLRPVGKDPTKIYALEMIDSFLGGINWSI
jgi:hypothetical protein